MLEVNIFKEANKGSIFLHVEKLSFNDIFEGEYLFEKVHNNGFDNIPIKSFERMIDIIMHSLYDRTETDNTCPFEELIKYNFSDEYWFIDYRHCEKLIKDIDANLDTLIDKGEKHLQNLGFCLVGFVQSLFKSLRRMFEICIECKGLFYIRKI